MLKTVDKKWGYEQWIVNNEMYCGKRMFLHRGHHCSFHYHKVKHETFYVEHGELFVITANWNAFRLLPDNSIFINGIEFKNMEQAPYPNFEYFGAHSIDYQILSRGDSIVIPPQTRHLFYGLTDSVFFEFSTHHEDNDSYRLTESA